MNNNPATLSKILTGINNTLNIANKVMPLYKEAKPLVQTVTKTYKNIKNNKNDLSNIIKLVKANNIIKKEENNSSYNKTKLIKSDSYNKSNNPTFFI